MSPKRVCFAFDDQGHPILRCEGCNRVFRDEDHVGGKWISKRRHAEKNPWQDTNQRQQLVNQMLGTQLFLGRPGCRCLPFSELMQHAIFNMRISATFPGWGTLLDWKNKERTRVLGLYDKHVKVFTPEERNQFLPKENTRGETEEEEPRPQRSCALSRSSGVFAGLAAGAGALSSKRKRPVGNGNRRTEITDSAECDPDMAPEAERIQRTHIRFREDGEDEVTVTPVSFSSLSPSPSASSPATAAAVAEMEAETGPSQTAAATSAAATPCVEATPAARAEIHGTNIMTHESDNDDDEEGLDPETEHALQQLVLADLNENYVGGRRHCPAVLMVRRSVCSDSALSGADWNPLSVLFFDRNASPQLRSIVLGRFRQLPQSRCDGFTNSTCPSFERHFRRRSATCRVTMPETPGNGCRPRLGIATESGLMCTRGIWSSWRRKFCRDAACGSPCVLSQAKVAFRNLSTTLKGKANEVCVLRAQTTREGRVLASALRER